MQAYIINLDERRDRWLSVESQLRNSNWSFSRVSAIDGSKINKETLCAPGVTAIWLSHLKAMERFLASEDQFALILEDDFNINKWNNLNSIIQKSIMANFDFVQIGYLKTSPFNSIGISTQNFLDLILKILVFVSRFSFLGKFSFFSRLLIQEQLNIPKDFVLNDIRAGAHCYLINRKFAIFALGINSPVFLSTDLLYMSLGHMRSLRMLRVRKSIVRQSNSPSSVAERFLKHN
jgi:GR25 family glycosyltransferase involved in LPS biosynthesis